MMRKLFFIAAFALAAAPLAAQTLPPVKVSFDVTDQNLLAGIAHAAGLYNAALPDVQAKNDDGSSKVNETGAPVYVSPKPGTLTPEQYATRVSGAAVKSWARQKFESDFQSGVITKTQRDAKFAEIDKLP
jgi:hypothetical protein